MNRSKISNKSNIDQFWSDRKINGNPCWQNEIITAPAQYESKLNIKPPKIKGNKERRKGEQRYIIMIHANSERLEQRREIAVK